MKKFLQVTLFLTTILLGFFGQIYGQSLSVTSTNPTQNNDAVPLSQNLVTNFSQSVSAGTASNSAIRAIGNKRGSYSFPSGGLYTGGGTAQVTYNPNRTFLPGEQLSLIQNINCLSTTGLPLASGQQTIFWGVTAPATAELLNTSSSSLGTTSYRRFKEFVNADLNNDGDLDIVFTYNNANDGTNLAFMLNDGFGSFSPPVDLYIGVPEQFTENVFTVGDLNNDGDIDIALVYEEAPDLVDYYLRIFTNNGSASFSVTNVFLNPNSGWNQIIAVDADSDGDLDLIGANTFAGQVQIRLNAGNSSFATATLDLFAATNVLSIVAGDFNGDRRVDFASTVTNSNNIRISLLSGVNTFTTTAYSPGGSAGINKIKILDLDSDGDLDVAADNFNDRSVVFMRNNGAGALSSPTSVAVNITKSIRDYELADFDGDGDFDLCIATTLSATEMYKNNGGAFTIWQTYTPFALSQNFGRIVSGDFDNDGDIDIVGKSNNSSVTEPIRFLRNENLVLTTGSVTGPVCTDVSFNLSYTATGGFNAGNVFSAQLSDASGNFTFPTTIGTLSSTALSGNIICVIPSTVGNGTGYRVRVVSSSVAFIGSQSNTFTVNVSPTVALSSRVCNSLTSTSITVSGATSYTWSPATGLNTTLGASIIASPNVPTTYTVVGTSNGCTSSASISVSNTCYCVGTYTQDCSSNDYIESVEFNNIDNTNTGCNGNLGNYIAHDAIGNLTTTLQAGESYNLFLNAGQITQGFGVWIDYNRDGDFNDANEFVYSVSPTNSASATITLPPSITEGESAMRVRSIWSATPTAADACNLQDFGETEDYKVTLVNQLTVTSTNPTQNNSSVSLTQNVVTNFSEAVSNSTADNSAIRVIGNKRGSYSNIGGGSFSGGTTNTVTYNPTRVFLPGEQLSLSQNLNCITNVGSFPIIYRQQSQFWGAAAPASSEFANPNNTTLAAEYRFFDQIENADLDNDGDLDIVFLYRKTDFPSRRPSLGFIRNNGAGTFSSLNIVYLGGDFDTGTYQINCFALGDVNNDGDIDIVGATGGTPQRVGVFANNGSGVFTSVGYTKSEEFQECKLADMDSERFRFFGG
jgi:hypothetical protein